MLWKSQFRNHHHLETTYTYDFTTFQTLKQILIVQSPSNIKVDDIIARTRKYTSVDFDGELFWRSELYDDYMTDVFNHDNISWLSSSQDIIRYSMIQTVSEEERRENLIRI